MKKILFIVSLIFVITGIVSAQSVKIITPQPNSTWFKGGQMNIKWSNDGCTSDNVKINIFKDSISVPNFVLQLTGSNGFKHWEIPADFPSGTYYMRIKTDPAQTGCLGDSGVFYIKLNATLKKSEPKISTNKGIKFGAMLNKIKVTQPVQGSAHEALKVMVISWKTDFAQYPTINMDFHRSDNSVAQHLLTDYNNSGSIGWAPPQKFATPGEKYYIRVYTSDNKYSGISGFFFVTPPQTTR